jgi:hypothetical protein
LSLLEAATSLQRVERRLGVAAAAARAELSVK